MYSRDELFLRLLEFFGIYFPSFFATETDRHSSICIILYVRITMVLNKS